MSVNKVNSDGSLLRVAGGTLYADLPIASEIEYAGTTPPNGFLACDGSTITQSAYPELYAIIGGTLPSKSGYIIKAKQVAVPFDVAEYIRNQNVLSDLEGWTGLDSPMPYDGIIYLTTHSDINYPRIKIYMNSEIVAEAGYNASSNTVVQCDSIPFMKGDIFSITGGEGLMSGYIRFYKLRDYTGR